MSYSPINPIEVENETYGNPDIRVDSTAVPRNDGALVPVADQSIDPVTGNPLAVTFPTPAEVIVGELAPASPSQDFATIPGQPPLYLPFPPAKTDPNIQAQSVTAGNPAEFTVAGPDISIQTNITPATVQGFTVTGVLDADTGLAPASTATRYKLIVTPPNLISFGISMLGRQIVFDDDTITADDEGASRLITGYGSNWIVIDKNDPADDFVPVLVDPQPGDTFTLDTQREASEVVSSTSPRPIDINVSTSTQPIQAAANVFL